MSYVKYIRARMSVVDDEIQKCPIDSATTHKLLCICEGLSDVIFHITKELDDLNQSLSKLTGTTAVQQLQERIEELQGKLGKQIKAKYEQPESE